jgi:hypothetical protein
MFSQPQVEEIVLGLVGIEIPYVKKSLADHHYIEDDIIKHLILTPKSRRIYSSSTYLVEHHERESKTNQIYNFNNAIVHAACHHKKTNLLKYIINPATI